MCSDPQLDTFFQDSIQIGFKVRVDRPFENFDVLFAFPCLTALPYVCLDVLAVVHWKLI